MNNPNRSNGRSYYKMSYKSCSCYQQAQVVHRRNSTTSGSNKNITETCCFLRQSTSIRQGSIYYRAAAMEIYWISQMKTGFLSFVPSLYPSSNMHLLYQRLFFNVYTKNSRDGCRRIEITPIVL